MNILVMFAVIMAAGGDPVQRTERSYNHYSSPAVYVGSQQFYPGQAASAPVYSAASYAPLSQATTSYGTPVSYVSSSTYNAPITQAQSAPLHNAPLITHVSSSSSYNAMHSSHVSASSEYRVQSPVTLTYAAHAPRAQYIEPRAQYIAPRTQYVAPHTQYTAPRTQYIAASSTWQNSASWGTGAKVDNINVSWY